MSSPLPTPNPSFASSQSSPKHWHGSLGDRYEHHNVWVRGGLSEVYYPKRSSSIQSENSAIAKNMERQSSNTRTPSLNNTKDNTQPPAAGERRQSGNGMLFSGLSTQKRNPLDTNLAARRESWKEQSHPGGFFSKWWEGYTKGP